MLSEIKKCQVMVKSSFSKKMFASQKYEYFELFIIHYFVKAMTCKFTKLIKLNVFQ